MHPSPDLRILHLPPRTSYPHPPPTQTLLSESEVPTPRPALHTRENPQSPTRTKQSHKRLQSTQFRPFMTVLCAVMDCALAQAHNNSTTGKRGVVGLARQLGSVLHQMVVKTAHYTTPSAHLGQGSREVVVREREILQIPQSRPCLQVTWHVNVASVQP